MDIQQENKKLICLSYGHQWQVKSELRQVKYVCQRCGEQMSDNIRSYNDENLFVTTKGELEVRRITNSGRISKKFKIF